jgi:hypothetical protein
LRSNGLWFRSNLEEAGLDEKIPHSTGLGDVDFDQISRFSPSEFAPSSCIFADECLFDNEIWFRQDTELRTEGLLCRGEKMQ